MTNERGRLSRLHEAARARGWHDESDQLLLVARSTATSGAAIQKLLARDFLSRNKLKAEVAAEVMSAALKERGPKVNTRALHAIAFLDITQSTDDLAKAGDEDWRARIQAFYDAARRLIEEVGGRVVKTTGDGFLAVFPTADGGLAAMSKAHRAGATMGFVCRTGMHLAETETVDERDIAGIGVNIAARVLGKAQPGRIVVTSAIRDSTQGSRHVFRAIGQTVLRGVPGEWSIFELAGIA